MRASLFEGIIGLALGIGAFSVPHVTELAFVYLVATWAVLTGLFEIFAVDRNNQVTLSTWLSVCVIVGLSWAFFVAGVPTQMVSQWSVDDAATARLMRAFYTNLKAGEGKSQALRKAALSLRQEKAHRHPYYWAPFLLIGDWRR